MEIIAKANEEGSCEISCNLTTVEFRKRKATVVAGLLSKIRHVEEVTDGYQFSFNYSPELVHELVEFINLEKICCPFFNFNISIHSNDALVRLSLTGAEGTKEFIKYELEMA